MTFKEFAWFYIRQYPRDAFAPYFFALGPWLLCVALLFAVTEHTTKLVIGQSAIFFILLIIGTINAVNDMYVRYLALRDWDGSPPQRRADGR